MKFTLPSHEQTEYSSVLWHESGTMPGVRYATRRISLSQRIELTKSVRELVLRNEFFKAGDTADQLEASIADLLARKLYLEWGLMEIRGLTIDRQPATVEMLFEKGPESLTSEIVAAVQAELGLTEQERKNS